jgi:hypothetical protein
MEELRASVLDAAIPLSSDVERMGRLRDVVGAFAPRSRAAEAYEALWAAVRARLAARP